MALFFLFADDASNHLSGHNFSSTRYTRALVCVCEPVSLNWLNGEKGGVSVCTKVWLQRWEQANPVTYPSWFWLLWSGSYFHKQVLCLPFDHFGLFGNYYLLECFVLANTEVLRSSSNSSCVQCKSFSTPCSPQLLSCYLQQSTSTQAWKVLRVPKVSRTFKNIFLPSSIRF